MTAGNTMNNGQQGMTREFLTGQGLSTRAVLRQQGFTLVEMMIVVVIMAIIASIAVPSYQNNIRKANRADGMDMALEVAQRMERCFTAYSAYNNAIARQPRPPQPRVTIRLRCLPLPRLSP